MSDAPPPDSLDESHPAYRSPVPGNDLHCPKDWEQAYLDGNSPWDLGAAPPSLQRVVAELVQTREAGDGSVERVFVPGTGRGHDARAFAAAGFDVTANDIAATAVAEGKALDAEAGLSMTWSRADLFALPADLDGSFDLVWEQTCFCAIPPARRDDYVAAVARLLRPGGSWVGVLWDVGRPGGPPFAINREHIEQHFLAAFEIVSVEDVPVWSDRRFDEILVRLRKRRITPGAGRSARS